MSDSQYEDFSVLEVDELEANKDIDGLIGVLKFAKSKASRKAAIRALGRIGNKNGMKVLITVASGKEWVPTLQSCAIGALGESGDTGAVEPLIIVLLKNEYDFVRAQAAEALGKLGDARAVDALIHALEDTHENNDVRKKAAEALGQIANRRAMEALIAVLRAEDSNICEKASLVLKKVGNAAVEPLISALGSEGIEIREKAAYILGDIGDNKAVEPLIAILEDKDEDYELREKAVEALGKIRDVRAVEPLIDAACHDTEHAVRCASVTALGDIGNAQAVEPLIGLLRDKSSPSMMMMRGLAAEALGKIGDDTAVEPLIRVLEDHREGEWVRDKAAWALLHLDDDRIELPLLKYFKLKLDAIAKLKAPEHDYEWEVLEAVGRLIARLINKAKMS